MSPTRPKTTAEHAAAMGREVIMRTYCALSVLSSPVIRTCRQYGDVLRSVLCCSFCVAGMSLWSSAIERGGRWTCSVLSSICSAWRRAWGRGRVQGILRSGIRLPEGENDQPKLIFQNITIYSAQIAVLRLGETSPSTDTSAAAKTSAPTPPGTE